MAFGLVLCPQINEWFRFHPTLFAAEVASPGANWMFFFTDRTTPYTRDKLNNVFVRDFKNGFEDFSLRFRQSLFVRVSFCANKRLTIVSTGAQPGSEQDTSLTDIVMFSLLVVTPAALSSSSTQQCNFSTCAARSFWLGLRPNEIIKRYQNARALKAKRLPK